MAKPDPKPPRESEVVMSQIILPSDANALGAVFGGRVMSWIDICAAIAAQRHCHRNVVTASMDDLHFHAPAKVGWIVTLKARVIAAFRSSMEVGVTVTAEDPLTGRTSLTTTALLTFVALDEQGGRVEAPQLLLETEAERRAFDEAKLRREERLSRKSLPVLWRQVLEAASAER